MKPFNLAAALAGAPVVTRDGQKVLQIAHFPKAIIHYRLVVLFDSSCNLYLMQESGIFFNGRDSSMDLFMAPVKRTVWVNVYRDEDGELYSSGSIFNSKHDAEKTAKGDHNYIGTYPLEIEE